MSCEPQVESVLRTHGLRRTPQRARILAVLRHAGGHLTAAQVHSRLAADASGADGARTPRISLSTVYRTLEGLQRAGVVSSLETHPGVIAYEWDEGPATHHHLLCTGCDAVIEIDLARLAGVEGEIRARTGFEANIRHLRITGLCARCRGTGTS